MSKQCVAIDEAIVMGPKETRHPPQRHLSKNRLAGPKTRGALAVPGGESHQPSKYGARIYNGETRH